LRWYYRKIRWVNATEDTPSRLLLEPRGMLPERGENGKWKPNQKLMRLVFERVVGTPGRR